MTDQQTHRQLCLLEDLATIFAREHLRAWLRGGWALDCLLGAITRPHADIDLVTWLRHRPRLHRLLPAHGFALDRELPVQTDFTKWGQYLQIVFVARRPDGRVVVPGIPGWRWRP
ncbi:MAG: nucleotidyltransferase domain-containing protein, partial [Chloroflexota bacterium]